MRSPGALAVTDGQFSPQIYEAIGSLVAIALERAAALERSSRLEAWREGERLRSALLDSVTHDLRTPLTAIRAAATTLASAPDLAECRAHRTRRCRRSKKARASIASSARPSKWRSSMRPPSKSIPSRRTSASSSK